MSELDALGLAAMRTLRDVEGVLGSFVVGDDGAPRLRDCPPIFDDVALAEAGSRLARLAEALEAGGDPLETCVLDYAEHTLFLRRMPGATLVVIAPRAVNLSALKMGANLVVRRLTRLAVPVEVPARAPAPPAPPAHAPPAPPVPSTHATRPAATPPPVPVAGPSRVYRGVRVT